MVRTGTAQRSREPAPAIALQPSHQPPAVRQLRQWHSNMWNGCVSIAAPNSAALNNLVLPLILPQKLGTVQDAQILYVANTGKALQFLLARA